MATSNLNLSPFHLDPDHISCIGGRTVQTCRGCAGNAPRYVHFQRIAVPNFFQVGEHQYVLHNWQRLIIHIEEQSAQVAMAAASISSHVLIAIRLPQPRPFDLAASSLRPQQVPHQAHRPRPLPAH